jgi:cytochrome c
MTGIDDRCDHLKDRLRQRRSGVFVKVQYSAVVLFIATLGSAAAQDAAKGEKEFTVCRACHQIGPNAKNAVGPVLNGVVGRKAGTYPGFQYSEPNKNSGLTWTPEELDTYLTDPQKVVPKTKMIFPGIKDPQKRQDVIAFLKQYGPDGNKSE